MFKKESGYVLRHSNAIAGISLGAMFLAFGIASWGQLTREEGEVSFPPSSEQGLLTELDRGVVAGTDEEYQDLRDEIMQLFTDFLNEFGRPVQQN